MSIGNSKKADTRDVSSQVQSGDEGLIVNSVIHGKSSAGGGTFVDVKVNPSGALTTESEVTGTEEDGSYPDPNVSATGDNVKINIDKYGNLRTRSEILTDELSFREDFSNGTCDASWIQTPSSGTITFATSDAIIGSGTANASNPSMIYELDYCPLTFRGKLSLSQRIENQSFSFGFIKRNAGVIQAGAWIEFSGTNNQKITTRTQSSSDSVNDTESNLNITLPNQFTTAQELYYKIDVSNNTVSFLVSQNGQFYFPLSQHILHIPSPYQALDFEMSFLNSAVVTNTTATVDLIFINNMNRIQVDSDYQLEPLPAQLIGSIGENLRQVGVTNTGALKVELAGNNISAFGDINVSKLEPILQIDFVYGILTALGSTVIVGTGVADSNLGRLRLQTGTGSTGSATFQTTKVAKYRPGQGIDARFTWAFTTGVANNNQIAGMGDTSNGYFFGYQGTSFGIFHYNNGSLLSFIPQTNWNVDTCDGTGISRLNINQTFGNIYKVKYPYLGYGDVFFFVQNPNDGQFQLVHIIKYANTTASTQLSNPNLTFFAQVVNTGNTTNIIGYCGSIGVFLSGERKFLGQTSFAFNNKSLTSAGGVVNLFTIRNATTFNGISNKALIRINSVILSAGNLGNNAFGYLLLLKNATLGGVPSFTPDSGTTVNNGVTITNGQSPASVDTAGTTVTGGTRVWGTNGVNTSNAFIDVTSVDIFIAPGETLTIAGQVTSNASLSCVTNYVLDI